ncbi:alpha-ketoglutarate-dependent taurine dioxygenase [Zopfochytrium polystomum]|nr:alpha-ketoglutarate-dependent taurine dioxygenase [Zopfochytrium polystomum]
MVEVDTTTTPAAAAAAAPAAAHAVKIPGAGSDPEKKALLAAASKVIESTPTIGTELHGVQLADLSHQQLDELARLVAERGVVFLRGQSSLTTEATLRIAKYWGNKLHDRTPMKIFEGHNELQSIRTDADSKYANGQIWHQDHPATAEPGAITFLHVRESPETGGDTVWSSLYGAYDKLTPAFRKIVDGLESLQEGQYYPWNAEYEPDRAIQPLVATHPVTGWKYLSVNRPYLKQLRGFKKAESDTLLEYLNSIPEKNLDLQVRFKWESDSVAIWDNRVVVHHAVWDYFPQVRTGVRFVVLGPTRPTFDPASKSRAEALGLVPAPFVFADVANEIEDIKGRNKQGVKFFAGKV